MAPAPALAPCVIVIFGGSGDLAKRKLVPSLLNLANEGVLPEPFAIVAVAGTPMDVADFRVKLGTEVREHVGAPFDEASWSRFTARLQYVSGDFSDSATYQKVQSQLAKLDREQGAGGNYLLSGDGSEVF
jgi:glucose-6-phosphate 1-dehydrogenase